MVIITFPLECFRGKSASEHTVTITPTTNGLQSPSQVAVGSGITQEINIDSSVHKGGIHIEHLEVGDEATVNIYIINYQDG